MKIHCLYDRLVPATELKQHPKNRNTHPPEQIDRLAEILRYQGWRYPVKVSNQSGFVTAGHGRIEAARLNGWKQVPVNFQDYESDEAEYADLTADNAIASWSTLDLSGINTDLGDLGPDFDVDMLGLKDFEIDVADRDEEQKAPINLAERFGAPPFSVLDTKQGYWQNRKRSWIASGLKSELGRAVNANSKIDEMATEFKTGFDAVAPETSIFDPVLCELLYHWFSTSGDTVVDPFAGGSVRGIVASKLDRQYIGIDLRDEQVEANRSQEQIANPAMIPVWISGDSLDMPILVKDAKADMILSCPPYADLEVYSDDERDISNMEYPQFLGAYRKIISNCYNVLRDDRFAVFVVGEVRSTGGQYYNFVGDTIKAFKDAGFSYYNEAILLNQPGTAAMRGNKLMQSSRKLVKVHQNVLVFYKGKWKNAVERLGDVFIPEMPDEPSEAAHDL